MVAALEREVKCKDHQLIHAPNVQLMGVIDHGSDMSLLLSFSIHPHTLVYCE